MGFFDDFQEYTILDTELTPEARTAKKQYLEKKKRELDVFLPESELLRDVERILQS